MACPPTSCDAMGFSPSPRPVDRVLEYMLDNPRLQPAADGYYRAACYGAFIAGMAVELRKLLYA